MSSFLTKNNLPPKDAKKCPNVLRFGIMNSENMSNDSWAKVFGKLQFKLRPADVMTFVLFCSSLDFGRKIGHLRT